MQSKWFVGLPLAAVLLASSWALAAEEADGFKSSLQPGERIAASFTCNNLTFPDQGKPLCYV